MASWSLHKKQEKMVYHGGDEDNFQEEDVWSAVRAREVMSKSKSKAKNGSPSSSSPPSAWQYSSATPRAIHRGRNDGEDASFGKRSSAPVNIPDWSKIYGKKKKNKRKGDDDSGEEGDDYHDNGNGRDEYRDRDGVEEDEDEDEEGMVPPHEWLARKLARSQISSFSVCEGIGRTLKGRDLSRVRNAILTKTGFLE
ncbi:hypothetical protein MLD38_039800 [Melastoma candidum]|uniref:Uncharacterized protein n=1 Tax=Melastoma candidum TaxID=119954 RepID=A0ACB9L4N1_9MYRT|nr:hypothetical protein MLD38_039800 [Melastoma candidum]